MNSFYISDLYIRTTMFKVCAHVSVFVCERDLQFVNMEQHFTLQYALCYCKQRQNYGGDCQNILNSSIL